MIKEMFRLEIPGKSCPQFYSCAVTAGFPSPADDYIENKLDLNDYLVKRPSATFFVRGTGDSMINAGIHNNDILIVSAPQYDYDDNGADVGKIVVFEKSGLNSINIQKNNIFWS